MKSLTDIVISIADLLEAEGRELRRNVARLGQGYALNFVASVLAAGGALLILWAFYQSMVLAFGPIPGALITGVVGLLSGGVMFWLAQLISR